MAAVFGNAGTARSQGDGAGGERGGVGGEAGIVGHWKEVRGSRRAPGKVAPNRPAAPAKGQIRTESKDLHAFFCSLDSNIPRLATRWQPSATNGSLWGSDGFTTELGSSHRVVMLSSADDHIAGGDLLRGAGRREVLTTTQRRCETLRRDVGHRVGDWNIGLLEFKN